MRFRPNTGVCVARCLTLIIALAWLSSASVRECRAQEPASPASEQAAPSGASVDTESGTITLIDKKNAIIVVAVPLHDDLSFDAKAHRDLLDSVKVGDKVTASYLEPYVTELSPANGAALTPLAHTVKVTQYAPGANEEGFQALRVLSGVVEVTGVDRKLNLLTFEDKSGAAHSVRVSRPDLLKVMQSLARHSRVRIAYESETTVVISR